MSRTPDRDRTSHQTPAPFYFNSSAHLLRIQKEHASNLGEFLDALRTCTELSVFQHTFRTLQEHHFIRQGFSNDFAHWAYTDCNEPRLAEQLASVDVRIFTSLAALRDRIVTLVEEYLRSNPRARDRHALKPFYFCASDTVVVPTHLVAHDLAEFLKDLQRVSVHSVYHHFIEARLRLKLVTNDFSLWLDNELGLKKAAASLNRIDIYTSTLEGVRHKIVGIAESVQSGEAMGAR
jgi:hypothetical protein